MLNLLLSAVLLQGSSQAPFADKLAATVTFTHHPARAEMFFPQLGEATGIPLMFDGAIKDEVLVIRVKDVPTSELLDNIAQVASGEWRTEAGGMRLVRPNSIVVREQAEERKLREDEFAKQLQEAKLETRPRLTPKTAKALADKLQGYVYDENASEDAQMKAYVDWRKTQSQLPAKYALARLTKVLSAKMVAGLPEGRNVLSLRPTRMQSALPGSAATILNDFVYEQNLIAQFAKPEPEGDHEEDWMMEEMWMGAGLTPLPAGAKPLLVINVAHAEGRFLESDGASFELTLKVVDRQGRVVVEEQGAGFFGEHFDMDESEPEPQPDSKPQSKEADLPLPPLFKEFVSISDNFDPKNLSEEFKAILSRPDLNDPLKLSVQSLLPGYGELKGVNVVARPVDSDLFSVFGRGPESITVKPSQLKELLEESGHVWSETGNWLTVRPSRPLHSRSAQLDRVRLRDASALLVKQHILTFDQMADYRDVVGNAYQPTPWLIAMFLLEREHSALNMPPQEQLLNIYGSLGANQRAASWSESGLPLSAFSGEQRQIAQEAVFRHGSGFIMFTGDESQSLEITEVLPNGLPLHTVFKGKGEPQPSFVADYDMPEGSMLRLITADALAYALLRQETNPAVRTPASYRPATNVSGEFGLYLDRVHVAAAYRFNSVKADLAAKRVGYDELPAEFKAKVKAAMERIRQEQQPGGGHVPPPPPH